MAEVVSYSFASIPAELLELVCSFLNARDIAQLEAVSKNLRCRLNDGKVWQALATRVAHRLKLPLGNALLHYAKENNLETQHYKIVIGVNAELQRALLELREASRKYNEARRDEEANYRTQKLIGIYQTGRNSWLKKMMKVSIQEKLMQAKIDQLLHHREELCFDEVPPENPTQVKDERLRSFFLERCSSSKSEYVKNSIMDYSGWLRKRIHPTDSEVELGLRLKSQSILESIRHIIEENEEAD